MAERPAKRARRAEPEAETKASSNRAERDKRPRDEAVNGHRDERPRSRERHDRRKERNRDGKDARNGAVRDRSQDRGTRDRRSERDTDRGHRSRREDPKARSRSPAREPRKGNVRTRSPPRGPRVEREQTRDRQRPPPPGEKHNVSDSVGRSQPSSRIPPAKWRKSAASTIEVEDPTEEEKLKATMGFGNFMTTRNTKVPGNNRNYAVLKEKKTEYRQYMNRAGGFNRPLSPG